MLTVTLGEAQARLPELIGRLGPGEEITIAEGGRPLARVTKAGRTSWPCRAGSAAGKVRMAPDFDAAPEGFEEYVG